MRTFLALLALLGPVNSSGGATHNEHAYEVSQLVQPVVIGGEVEASRPVCSGQPVLVLCKFCKGPIQAPKKSDEGKGVTLHFDDDKPTEDPRGEVIAFEGSVWLPCLDCKRPNLMTEGFYRANDQFLEFAEGVLPLFRKNYELVKAFSEAMGPKLKGGDYHFTTQAGALVGLLEQVPREELVQMRDAALAAKQEGTPAAVAAFVAAYPAFTAFLPKDSGDLASWMTLIVTIIFGILALTKGDPKPPQVVIQHGLGEDKVKELIAADREHQLKLKNIQKNKAKRDRKKRR